MGKLSTSARLAPTLARPHISGIPSGTIRKETQERLPRVSPSVIPRDPTRTNSPELSSLETRDSGHSLSCVLVLLTLPCSFLPLLLSSTRNRRDILVFIPSSTAPLSLLPESSSFSPSPCASASCTLNLDLTVNELWKRLYIQERVRSPSSLPVPLQPLAPASCRCRFPFISPASGKPLEVPGASQKAPLPFP